MKILLCFCFLVFCSLFIYVNTAKFGSNPAGDILNTCQKSPNYQNGQFHNQLTKNRKPLKKTNPLKILIGFLQNQEEEVVILTVKTDLKKLNIQEDILIWFGHSSYFIQLEGLRIIIDPVFSKISSPVPWFPKAFKGSNIYQPSDIPPVDYLIITHDHWDHLDYETVTQLNFKKVICPLGVRAHFKKWKIQEVDEMDWGDSKKLSHNFQIFCLPSKHFSGRGLFRNKTLWASFLLVSPSGFKIFIGGDGGYDSRFSKISEKFGSIDVAILENGQYNACWPNIHMFPEETLKAAEDLRASSLLPVHNSKFALSTHPWFEPLEKLSNLSETKNLRILTPRIGEKVELKNNKQIFKKWWREVLNKEHSMKNN